MKDFLNFKKLITPLVIKIIFWVGVISCIITGLGMIFSKNIGFGLAVLFLGPIAVRIYCELLILLFNINDTLTDLKNNAKNQVES